MVSASVTPSEAREGERKLLLGELVEVRQKEKGLRGSWHPGLVVKVWSGRRSVEYDELLSKDGIHKLRECIPVPRGADGISQHGSRLSTPKERTFIRPRPPPCTGILKESWKKGLWVDVFYEDAWWEGILMEDVLLTEDEDRVIRVFFPDEGDEAEISLKELRIMQVWDDETGLWSIKGYSLSEETGEPLFTSEMHEELDEQRRNRSSLTISPLASCEIDDQPKSQELLMHGFGEILGGVLDGTCIAERGENMVNFGPMTKLGTSDCPSMPKLGTVDHNEVQTGCCSIPKLGRVEGNDDEMDCPSMPKLGTMDDNEVEIDCRSIPELGTSDCSEVQTDCPDMPKVGIAHNNEVQSNCPSMSKLDEVNHNEGVLTDCPLIPKLGTVDHRKIQTECLSIPKLGIGDNCGVETDRPSTSKLGTLGRTEVQTDHLSMSNLGALDYNEVQTDCQSMPNLGTLDCNEVQTDCLSMPKSAYNEVQTDHSVMPKLGLIDHADHHMDASLRLQNCVNNNDENNTNYFSTPKRSRAVLVDSSKNEQGEQEETLEEWMTTAKRQALEGGLESKVNATDAFSNHGVEMIQGSVIGTITGASTSEDNKQNCLSGLENNAFNGENLVSHKNENIKSDSLKGKAKACQLYDSYKTYSALMSSEIIQEIRERARKTLQEAGWIIHFRWWSGREKIAYYISPDGTKYSNLTDACTEWRRLRESDSNNKLLKENGVQEFLHDLLLSKGIHCGAAPCTSEKKMSSSSRKHVISTNGKRLRCSKKTVTNSQTGTCQRWHSRQDISSGKNHAQPRKTKPTKLLLSHAGPHADGTRQKKDKLQSCHSLNRSLKKRKYGVLEGNPRGRAEVKERKKDSETRKPMRSSKKSHARSSCRLEVLLSAPERERTDEDSEIATSKSTIISWLIDMGAISENEKVRYLSDKEKHVMMEGQLTRDGILCRCCKTVWALYDFELHAGSTLRRPYANIFVTDGRSLFECQMLALKTKGAAEMPNKPIREANISDPDGNDDTCGVCGDGGELICCDHCPSTFHLSCVQLENVPEDDWYCPYCQCAVCHGSVFCEEEAFDKMSNLHCCLCGREYHVACLHGRDMPKVDRYSEENEFCGYSCDKIFQGLQGLVGSTNGLEDGYTWTLLHSAEDDPLPSTEYGLQAAVEHNSKLAVALSVMQECFRPMVDTQTGIELISHILYNRGSELKRLNFKGFYSLLLEKGDELISVASIRVHGARLAEMPLIGTRFLYRRQGMCRRLMNVLEEILKSLGIQMLVLPAVLELLETWTHIFGFEPVTPLERFELVGFNISVFPGTTLLQKSVVNPKPLISQLKSASGFSSGVPSSSLQPLPADSTEYGGKMLQSFPADSTQHCGKSKIMQGFPANRDEKASLIEVLAQPVPELHLSNGFLPHKINVWDPTDIDHAEQIVLDAPFMSPNHGTFKDGKVHDFEREVHDDIQSMTQENPEQLQMPFCDQGRSSDPSLNHKEFSNMNQPSVGGDLDDPTAVVEELKQCMLVLEKLDLHAEMEPISDQELKHDSSCHGKQNQQNMSTIIFRLPEEPECDAH